MIPYETMIYKRQFGQFIASFKIIPSNGSLMIMVQDTQNFNKFNKIIDQDYIKSQDATFQCMFQEPHDIIEHFSKSGEEIIFENNILKFNYSFGVKKKMKMVQIELEGEEVDQVQILILKSQKLKKEFTNQLLQRDKRLNQFQDQCKRLEEKITQAAQSAEKEIQEVKSKLKIQEEDNKGLKQELNKSKKEVQELTLAVTILILSEFAIKSQLFLGHYPGNSHKENYQLSNITEKSILITKNSSNGYHNFVNKFEIFPNTKIKYSVTIRYIKDGCLLIGFCTAKGLGKESFHRESESESAYFEFYEGGKLWEGGNYKSIQTTGKEGDVITCTADTLNGKLIWSKGENMIAECNLPPSLKSKIIYFSAIIYYGGNQIFLSLP